MFRLFFIGSRGTSNGPGLIVTTSKTIKLKVEEREKINLIVKPKENIELKFVSKDPIKLKVKEKENIKLEIE